MCGPKPCDKQNCTWAEKHRRECEARTVMRWDKDRRNAYFSDVKKKRGEAAAKELIGEVNEQWKTSQQSLL